MNPRGLEIPNVSLHRVHVYVVAEDKSKADELLSLFPGGCRGVRAEHAPAAPFPTKPCPPRLPPPNPCYFHPLPCVPAPMRTRPESLPSSARVSGLFVYLCVCACAARLRGRSCVACRGS